MTASPDAHALHAGMRHIEHRLQRLFDEMPRTGATPATLGFDWKGGQAGADIPVSEAVTLEASSPGGNGKLVLRQGAVAGCAQGVGPELDAALRALAARMAEGI